MLRASVDIGSNTILLLVGEVADGIREIVDRSRITSLGRDLDKNRAFHPDSIESSLKALGEYREIAENHGVSPENAVVTATEAGRVATNRSEFFNLVERQTGFKTRIINPRGEAYYTALGVSLDHKSGLVMDLGGASTELIQFQTRPFKLNTISIPVGSVRCRNWDSKKIKKILTGFDLAPYRSDEVIGVAGSMVSLGAMAANSFDRRKIENTVVGFEKFEKLALKTVNSTPQTVLSRHPFLGKRSQTVAAGFLLALEIGQTLGVKEFKISTKGLRHGTLMEGTIKEDFLGQF